MNCKFCGKDCKNVNSLRNHERLCKENPNRQESNLKHRKSITPWNKGLTKDDPRVAKHAENVSKSLKGKAPNWEWTVERRKAKSEWKKQLHKDNPEMHPNRKLAGNRKKMSYPEKVAYDFLTNNKIHFLHNVKIGAYYPDFVVGDCIIEIDGERWHDKEKDAIRDRALNALGYIVYRIDTREHIENKIKEFLGVG